MNPDRDKALRQSNDAADQQFGRRSVDGSTGRCGNVLEWIDIQMVGDDDAPVPNLRFQVFRPDGTLLGEGRLDDDGCGGFERIEDGDYEVCFPDLDQDAWGPA